MIFMKYLFPNAENNNQCFRKKNGLYSFKTRMGIKEEVLCCKIYGVVSFALGAAVVQPKSESRVVCISSTHA